MHEMSYVSEIVKAACAKAKECGALRVVNMTLRVGVMRDFHQEFLDKYFEHFCKGTIAEGMEVTTEFVPAFVRCAECGVLYPVDTTAAVGAYSRCPQHPQAAVSLVSGMELAIESLGVIDR
jgi:hydrogenase nickel incorporation protein HypA/HybF